MMTENVRNYRDKVIEVHFEVSAMKMSHEAERKMKQFVGGKWEKILKKEEILEMIKGIVF